MRWFGIWPKAFEPRTPPLTVQIIPVPAQAMHPKNPRRSTPSLFEFSFIRRDNCFLLLEQPCRTCVSLSGTELAVTIFPLWKSPLAILDGRGRIRYQRLPGG